MWTNNEFFSTKLKCELWKYMSSTWHQRNEDAEIDHFIGKERYSIGLVSSTKRKKEQNCLILKSFVFQIWSNLLRTWQNSQPILSIQTKHTYWCGCWRKTEYASMIILRLHSAKNCRQYKIADTVCLKRQFFFVRNKFYMQWIKFPLLAKELLTVNWIFFVSTEIAYRNLRL